MNEIERLLKGRRIIEEHRQKHNEMHQETKSQEVVEQEHNKRMILKMNREI